MCDGAKSSNIKIPYMGVMLQALKNYWRLNAVTLTAVTYNGFSSTFIQKNEAAPSAHYIWLLLHKKSRLSFVMWNWSCGAEPLSRGDLRFLISFLLFSFLSLINLHLIPQRFSSSEVFNPVKPHDICSQRQWKWSISRSNIWNTVESHWGQIWAETPSWKYVVGNSHKFAKLRFKTAIWEQNVLGRCKDQWLC